MLTSVKKDNVMNKIIRGAKFSMRDGKEQRIRLLRRGLKLADEPDDVRDIHQSWDRAAEGLEPIHYLTAIYEANVSLPVKMSKFLLRIANFSSRELAIPP